MTSKFLMTTATITALIAAPMAYAQTTTEEITPADISQTRAGVGIAEYDPTGMSVTQEEYDVLSASVGKPLLTTANEAIGTITGVGFDGQGNVELAVDLPEDTDFEADLMRLRLLPGSVTLVNEQVILDTTVDALKVKVIGDDAQGGSDREVTISVM
ncbi:hypothetical protein [uncultured Sulfitobacter sp.]|uniref:hypothetical protein n=1 Tax=uncultured Sulfitobacter sp. TaxID=191468 RepID=UPI00262CD889|nr:hypothetical protein [uncultured Sulfitobacter sp.]